MPPWLKPFDQSLMFPPRLSEAAPASGADSKDTSNPRTPSISAARVPQISYQAPSPRRSADEWLRDNPYRASYVPRSSSGELKEQIRFWAHVTGTETRLSPLVPPAGLAFAIKGKTVGWWTLSDDTLHLWFRDGHTSRFHARPDKSHRRTLGSSPRAASLEVGASLLAALKTITWKAGLRIEHVTLAKKRTIRRDPGLEPEEPTGFYTFFCLRLEGMAEAGWIEGWQMREGRDGPWALRVAAEVEGGAGQGVTCELAGVPNLARDLLRRRGQIQGVMSGVEGQEEGEEKGPMQEVVHERRRDRAAGPVLGDKRPGEPLWRGPRRVIPCPDEAVAGCDGTWEDTCAECAAMAVGGWKQPARTADTTWGTQCAEFDSAPEASHESWLDLGGSEAAPVLIESDDDDGGDEKMDEGLMETEAVGAGEDRGEDGGATVEVLPIRNRR